MSVAKAAKVNGKKGDAHRTASAVSGRNVFDFVGDVKGEMKKITWTPVDELKSYTKIVVAATFAAGFAIYAIDVSIQLALSGLGLFMRLFTG